MTQTLTADGRDRWLVPSASQPEPRIVIRAKGVLTCDCPANLYRRSCRHILAVQTVLAAEEATRAAARRELRAEGGGLLLAAGRRQEVA